jgi:uncharacterized protein DUF6282
VTYSKENRPFVSVFKGGHLLPEVEQVIDLAAKYQLTLETGHCSAQDGLLIVHQARQKGVRGVRGVVVTHAMASPVQMTIPQMQQAAREGAYIEFVYGATLPPSNAANAIIPMSEYAKAIRAVGPQSCILSSDLGQPKRPLHPDGLVMFFDALRKEGISQVDIDLMSKTNPARALGLQ